MVRHAVGGPRESALLAEQPEVALWRTGPPPTSPPCMTPSAVLLWPQSGHSVVTGKPPRCR
jgi:hypothetical protein